MNKRGFIHLRRARCHHCQQPLSVDDWLEMEDDQGQRTAFHKHCWLDYLEENV